MSEIEILIAVAQGLFALLLGGGGWLLRRALDDLERLRDALPQTRAETEREIAHLRERLIRAEGRLDGLDRIEAKLERLFGEIKEVREKLAALGSPQR